MYKVKSYNMLNDFIALAVVAFYAIGTVELVGWETVAKILVDTVN